MIEAIKVKHVNNMRETAGRGSKDPLPTFCRNLLPRSSGFTETTVFVHLKPESEKIRFLQKVDTNC
jgi:hypothetical protein